MGETSFRVHLQKQKSSKKQRLPEICRLEATPPLEKWVWLQKLDPIGLSAVLQSHRSPQRVGKTQITPGPRPLLPTFAQGQRCQ